MSEFYMQQYQSSQFLADNGNRHIEDVIKPSNEIKIARATVELYTSRLGDSNWSLIETGMLYLMKNHDVFYLILFATDTFQAVWQQQITRNITYKVERPYFHAFSFKNMLFGINFADLTEAEIFYNGINRLWTFPTFKQMCNNVTTMIGNLFSRKRKPPKRINYAVPDVNAPRAPMYQNATTAFGNGNEFQTVQPYDYEYSNRGEYHRHPHEEDLERYTTRPSGTYAEHDHPCAYNNYISPAEVDPPPAPPLPPPVANFTHISISSNRKRKPTNSFESQIKHEASKRRSNSPKFSKYLP